jgi:DNA-binding NarL/FixJ family response regulator
MDGEIKILLADRQSLFRDAMRVILETHDDLRIVAEASEGIQAVHAADDRKPDIALIDAELPNCDGIRATELIRDRNPECRTLVLSDHDDEQTLIAAIEAGAAGYLSKNAPIADLVDAARRISAGETIVPAQMLGALLARLVRKKREFDEARRRLARLTRREREVLALLALGLDNEGIAQPLVISPETARTHIQNVLQKLGVHSRLEAAAFVSQNELAEEIEGVDV